jgi:carbonic anhydrase
MRFVFPFFTLLISSSLFADIIPNPTPAKNNELTRTMQYAKGNQDFKNIVFKEHEQEFLRLVTDGQSPKTCFISCSDSRVIPELITKASPGQFFVIRTAGNFVSTYDTTMRWDGVAATIEYAVEVLEVKDIIVCGHSHCGAIQGLFSKDIENSPKYKLLSRWLKFGEKAKLITNRILAAKTPDRERFQVAERISVLVQLDHLLSYPFIKQKVEEKKVFLHGWHFTIETGEITYFDPETFSFSPISNLIPTINEVNQTQVQEQTK